MADMQALFSVIDHLTVEELRQLRGYIEQRTQTTLYVLSADQLRAIDETMRLVQHEAESMSETEINAVIAAAIAEVRRERSDRAEYIRQP